MSREPTRGEPLRKKKRTRELRYALTQAHPTCWAALSPTVPASLSHLTVLQPQEWGAQSLEGTLYELPRHWGLRSRVRILAFASNAQPAPRAGTDGRAL